MERKPLGQYSCKHHKLLQTLRSRLCTTFSLPTVNAATLYQRIIPPEAQSDEAETLGEDFWKTVKSEKELEVTDVLASDTSLSSDGDAVFNTGEENETGWQRIKQAYTFDSDTQFMPLEIQDLVFLSFVSMGLGFIYGGLPASQLGRTRYKDRSQGAVYETRFHAVSESYNAGNRGLIRYGMRWGWRVAFVATSFHFLSTCLSLYRNKVDMLNYGIAGFLTGAIYRFNLGARGMIGGGVAGLIVGLPAGFSLLVMQKLAGVSTLERSLQYRAECMKLLEKTLDTTQQENAQAIEYMDKWLKEKEKRTEEDKAKR